MVLHRVDKQCQNFFEVRLLFILFIFYYLFIVYCLLFIIFSSGRGAAAAAAKMALQEISRDAQHGVWVHADVDEHIVQFTQRLRRRQIVGSGAVARETIALLVALLR